MIESYDHKAMSEIRLTEQAIDIELNRLSDELKSRNAEEIDLLEVEKRFENRSIAETELGRIETRIERLGPINLVALGEYQQELERKSELDHQHARTKRGARDTWKMLFEKLIERRVHYSGIRSMRLTDRLVKSSHNCSVVERLG